MFYTSDNMMTPDGAALLYAKLSHYCANSHVINVCSKQLGLKGLKVRKQVRNGLELVTHNTVVISW